ncbi:MAG: type I glyceraldehyde-3-phosphate dehydrogenase [Bacteroidetes bacterium RIFCSPLOWO2_02_FULL_36_8]|nr:MAG: type I glyceraldehyde-3-phosphate dehydrogenase [Bacteroidetes bacterium RIFCSPLOWO2_02_FULL_36_8]OFY72189.1 MAG: type I glyceraldehyde-3-phosphate dehydrogenase [Bacteroidetes bacterium RIFCSPLOWO2_12_FULL_37_12]
MFRPKVAINGFGRIGRLSFRALTDANKVDIVAINDITDTKTLSHLLKYDSVQMHFHGEVYPEPDAIVVNGRKIRCFAIKEPSKLPWSELGVDIVLESSGKFTTRVLAMEHIHAGAKKVIISAPADKDVKTIVMGVNDSSLTNEDIIISNASCTTNCLAPMLKVLDDHWGIESGFISTVHAYTSDQRLHDSPHKDLRRARAATVSIIPTSTGAAKAATMVLPQLKGKLYGKAIRVPVPDGSLTDVVCRLKKQTTREEINAAFLKTAQGVFKGVVEYTDEPIVSVDIIGNRHSVVFDSLLTEVMGYDVNIVGWYDNEGGYSWRVADLIARMGELMVG